MPPSVFGGLFVYELLTNWDKFVIWICKKFTCDEIQEIIVELLNVTENKKPGLKSKNYFKQRHPNYRQFKVVPLLPLTESPKKHNKEQFGFKLLLDEYINKYGEILKPVKTKNISNSITV